VIIARVAKRVASIMLFSAVALLALSSPAMAQAGPTATGRAQAEVVIPISAVSLRDLSFGSIVIGPAGTGTVEVGPDGGPPRYANTARAGCSGATDCLPHRASFEVSGDPNRSYLVSLPERLFAYGVQTGARLPVIGIAMRSANVPSVTSGGRLDNAGRDRFFVGGVLQVPGGTRPDVFRAELPVIVTYN
jgi:hypothetical protein